jgi:hypothetical protein
MNITVQLEDRQEVDHPQYWEAGAALPGDSDPLPTPGIVHMET